MIFTSFEFVLFFLAVLILRACMRSFAAEKWFLLVASYVFYMSWSIPCGFLILFTSLVDFWVGAALGRMENERTRKILLVVSLTANLGVLGFFKYTNFLLGNVHWAFGLFGLHTMPLHYDILLPVGVSFFTFQSMSYTIDVYRRHIPASRSARDFLLFVAFFPQLVAGPIVRAADFLPQLRRRVRASIPEIESGLAQFGLGAVKKIVISDQISPHVDMIFAAPGSYDAVTLIVGVLGYAVQIYCDFSGYSDMAIGCARIMGFHFIENFQMPYSSVNITEFWRRWHISLSTWFRDYVYIPLGGNRKGTERTYVNLMITMLLCGLWHGASWNFVFWGGLHGLGLAIHRLWKTKRPVAEGKKSPLIRHSGNAVARLLTLGVVLIGWIFFREQSWPMAWEYLERIVTFARDGNHFISPYILIALAAVIITHVCVPRDYNWALEIPGKAIPSRVLSYAGLILVLALFAATDASPFIYFQF
jgi:alginate O-acetyltransferase complex protein AlgI